MITKKFITGLLAATFFVGVPSIAFGQDFDDDIYYNPSKEKKTTTSKANKKTIKYVPTPDYPAADTYNQPAISVGTVDDKTLDAYNRRGIFAVADTANAVAVPLDSLGEFEYTRRIEQFHNPDVVTNTGDQDLIEYYYNQGLQDGLQANSSAVNIYLNGYDPFWYPYNYYRPYYSSWYYNNWVWGPSWNWGWYDPFWGPSWSWGPSWGWGPSWSWGWGPGWGGYYPPVIAGPQYSYRPTGVGSSRPHAATTGAGSTMGRRPGSGISSGTVANGSFSRPGNMGRGRGNVGTVGTGTANTGSAGTRYSTPVQNNQNSGSQSRPGNMGRGRNNSSNSSQSNSSWSNSSRGSYSSGSSLGGGRSSGGSYGGGSSGGGRGRGR